MQQNKLQKTQNLSPQQKAMIDKGVKKTVKKYKKTLEQLART